MAALIAVAWVRLEPVFGQHAPLHFPTHADLSLGSVHRPGKFRGCHGSYVSQIRSSPSIGCHSNLGRRVAETKYGLGKHMWEISAVDFQEFMKIGMIAGLLTYNLATLFIKVSILAFYLRFSIDRAFRLAVYFVMFVTVGYTVPNAILVLYACRPMHAYWDFAARTTGHCLDLNAPFHTANTLNMLTDFAILLLPIWMLRPMKVPFFQKIGVALILMAGGLYTPPSPPLCPAHQTQGSKNADHATASAPSASCA